MPHIAEESFQHFQTFLCEHVKVMTFSKGGWTTFLFGVQFLYYTDLAYAFHL